MGDDVMSQDEINDLLGDIGAGAETEEEPSGQEEQVMVKIYDFLRPEIFSTEELSLFTSKVERLVRSFCAAAGGLAGTEITGGVTSIDPLTLDECMRCQPNPSFVFPVVFSSSRRGGLLFTPSTAAALARLFMGLPGGPGLFETDTPEDETLRAVFFKLAAISLSKPLTEHLAPCRLEAPATRPDPAVLGDPLEMVLAASFEIGIPEYDITGLSSLVMPAGFLLSLLREEPPEETPHDEGSGILVNASLEFPAILEAGRVVQALSSMGDLPVDPHLVGSMFYRRGRETT